MPIQLTSTIKNRTNSARTKFFNRACKANALRQTVMDRQTRPKKTTPYNSTYPKVAGQCEYEHLYFKQTLVRIDSLVF